MDKAKALTLPELLETVPSGAFITIENEQDEREVHIIPVGRHCHSAAAELRRLHAERTAADGVINDLVAKVRELQKENESLASALAASCDEARDQMWESGGVSGCSRALSAEFQRDALLKILKHIETEFRKHGRQDWPEAVMARKGIAAVEGKKT